MEVRFEDVMEFGYNRAKKIAAKREALGEAFDVAAGKEGVAVKEMRKEVAAMRAVTGVRQMKRRKKKTQGKRLFKLPKAEWY